MNAPALSAPPAGSEGRVISDLPEGTRLAGRYTVQHKLADGAVASVYRATRDDDGAVVALKVLDPLRGADPVGRQRFEREFDVLTQLHHDGFSRCLALERDGDLDILVLEFVEGETLQARLKKGRMQVREAIQHTLELCAALELCHGQGVLHRDLKPANIMLHPVRGAVILDFGVAWFSSAANLTRTGAVVGSPQYLAPEALSSALWDARADIYALGVMLFEMLTGRPVHLANGVAELALLHAREDPPRVNTIRPDVDATLADVVARAVAPRPEQRFASVRELARSLQEHAPHSGKALQARLPCKACGTPLVIDLPFCPGCGVDAEWELGAGPFAVQLDDVPNIPATAAWLSQRYGASLKVQRRILERRLLMTPVPLVVNASAASAEQLAAEARELGCRVEVVRARAVLGARLKASAARTPELLAAAAMHLGAVTTLGGVMLALDFPFHTVAMLPALMAIVGVGVAAAYVRRPMLRSQGRQDAREADQGTRDLRQRLASIRTPRAQRMAAGAVARAAPLLLRESVALRAVERAEALQLLNTAVDAAVAMDKHCVYLETRSRSRLAVELEEANARAAVGDPSGVERVAALNVERQQMLDAALAHDHCAREALKATAAISEVLSLSQQRQLEGKTPEHHKKLTAPKPANTP